MDWLTTATESQWQKEEVRMPGGLIASREDPFRTRTVTAAIVAAKLLQNPGAICGDKARDTYGTPLAYNVFGR